MGILYSASHTCPFRWPPWSVRLRKSCGPGASWSHSFRLVPAPESQSCIFSQFWSRNRICQGSIIHSTEVGTHCGQCFLFRRACCCTFISTPLAVATTDIEHLCLQCLHVPGMALSKHFTWINLIVGILAPFSVCMGCILSS